MATSVAGRQRLASSHQQQKEADFSLPKPGVYAAHRNLKKGLVPAAELQVPDAEDEAGDPLDYVSVARFPPGVAAILRRRLADSFAQTVSAWEEANAAVTLREVSSRGPLGLTILPTPSEDYRLFDVLFDLVDETDLRIMKAWHPSFDLAKYPPLIYHRKQPGTSTSDSKKKKPKAKAPGAMDTVGQSKYNVCVYVCICLCVWMYVFMDVCLCMYACMYVMFDRLCCFTCDCPVFDSRVEGGNSCPSCSRG